MDAVTNVMTGVRDVERDDCVGLRCAKGKVTVIVSVNCWACVQVGEIFAEHGDRHPVVRTRLLQ